MNQNALKHLPREEDLNQIMSQRAYNKCLGRENLHEAEVM